MHASPVLLQNVSVDNQLCCEIGVATSVNTISCGNKIGNSIKVQLKRFGILSLCEVQVLGFTPTATAAPSTATPSTATPSTATPSTAMPSTATRR